jgi:integrase/recombinase XerD
MNLESYLSELKAKRLSSSTISNYFKVLRNLQKLKPLEDVTKDDLVKFFSDFKGSDNSILLNQAIIKKFYNDMDKSEIVSWIKFVKPKESLKSDDILTPDDINKMIESTDSHYWKALIAFLFETGCRKSEVQKIRYKDLQDTDKGMIVNIQTMKNSMGFRKVIIPFSSQYIRNLKTYTNAKPNDIVFHLCYSHTYDTLLEIAQKAGIKKPISPHKFRHAQATDLVKRGYNEAIIRKKLGWTPTSPMIARYQHLNDEDVINATLENTGKLPMTAAPRIEIKEAERVTLVDAAMQFSKLTEDNETLKADNETLKTEMETMRKDMEKIQEFIKMGGMEIMKKG